MQPTQQIKDSLSINRISALHPRIRMDVTLSIIEAESKLPKNCMVRIVQGFRSFAEQDALYAQGRTKPGKIVTNAKGGQSYHCYSLAVDFVLMYDKDKNGTYETADWHVDNNWIIVVEAFKKRGFDWGGYWKFKDYPHLQKLFGNDWQSLLKKYQNKDFIKGTQFVNL